MLFSEQEIEEFKAEALELLEIAEKSLLSLDQGAEFRSAFDAVFRGFHNLKGASGMMELTKLQAHTHELENILMTFKSATRMPSEYVSLFLRGIDACRAMLNGEDVPFDFTVSSNAFPSVEPSVPTVEVMPKSQEIPPEAIEEYFSECTEVIDRVVRNLQAIEAGSHSRETLDNLFRDFHSMKGASYLDSFTKIGDMFHAIESSMERLRSGTHAPSKPLVNTLFLSIELIETLISRAKKHQPDDDCSGALKSLIQSLNEFSLELEEVSAKSAKEVKDQDSAVHLKSAPAGSSPEAGKESEGASSIRVPVALLDNLMTLMGEMVLVRNQVLQYSNKSEDLEFLSMSKRLNVVTTEIQGEMMKTRMQPIGNVIGKFNRVVRDLSRELNKNIQLNLFGVETELDKSLLEAIKDPLTHIVRNSCDHGIELPEVRRKAGKANGGTINIRSYHEGGQVIIEVQDDGKGLHKETLLKKAIEKGIVTKSDSIRLTDKEIFNLIFAPGFSTAAKVTNVSGRGVGMDVVRTNIEKIGGTVDLSSQAGVGTIIKLKIPLTLAIIPALIVKSGAGTYAIPQVKLEELVRVDQSTAENKIEILHGAPVYRLRGNILPLVDLNQVLNLNKKTNFDDGAINIAVLNAENISFGLIIDEIQDTADIVVKPINRLLKSLQIYSGATILGNGSVALILDVLGVSKVAKLGAEKARAIDIEKRDEERLRKLADIQDYLLVKVNSPAKHAIVLNYVHRLEEFNNNQIEYAGNQPVVRYGDLTLPLIFSNECLGYPKSQTDREIFPAVVVQRSGKKYGLVVDFIIDTYSSNLEVQSTELKQVGIFGSINAPEELIVVIDPFELIDQKFPDLGKKAVFPLSTNTNEPDSEYEKKDGNLSYLKRSSAKAGSTNKILLVEDTMFFRKTIKKIFEENGYQVVTANDGKEALDILEAGEVEFDIVVSDIEMPRVNGFQLAEIIKKKDKTKSLPLLAVSSRAENSYIQEGLKAGYDFYMEKLQPEQLLTAVAQLIKNKGRAA
jgi:two-component system chemotaxis sensor kinase CheA